VTGVVIDGAARRWRLKLGPVPWFVLEELLLDPLGTIDDDGLVVPTSARSLAAAVSLNKDTVVRALGLLRAAGLVVGEQGTAAGGRFGHARYRVRLLEGVTRFETADGTRPTSGEADHPAPAPSARPSRSRSRPAVTGTQLQLLDLPDADPDPPVSTSGHRPRKTPDALAPGVPRPVPGSIPDGEKDRTPEDEPC
jgi:hypothetical protein